MRSIGESRLYVAAVYFIIRKRYYRGRVSLFTGATTAQDGHNGLKSVKSPDSLPSFDRVIPAGDGWEVIEGSFLLVWIVQTSHVTANMYSGPGVTSDDGMFTVYIVNDASRLEILQLLLTMDSGGHVKHPKLRSFKCTAYRIEPFNGSGSGSGGSGSTYSSSGEGESPTSNTNINSSNKNNNSSSSSNSSNSTSSSSSAGGLYTLDGETVEYGPIQGLMKPGAGRIKKFKR